MPLSDLRARIEAARKRIIMLDPTRDDIYSAAECETRTAMSLALGFMLDTLTSIEPHLAEPVPLQPDPTRPDSIPARKEFMDCGERYGKHELATALYAKLEQAVAAMEANE